MTGRCGSKALTVTLSRSMSNSLPVKHRSWMSTTRHHANLSHADQGHGPISNAVSLLLASLLRYSSGMALRLVSRR
jgi:hypothetical protein